ncbi:YdeI/OmpD-associated family protein [Paenibacillus sp. GYB004]|uniref:YdeI/OmpD-associated family protein n=1 Tax=Paenibacillus sp. GYB004 TaxID=2994393 RepID=UPI002F96104F
MKFPAVILASKRTATGIQVPDEVVAALGSSKRPPVRVTIQGYTYRTTVASMGGVFMIPLSAEHRSGAGVAAGDEVTVEIELDTEVRELAVPEDVLAAIERDPGAKSFFDGLSYSNKRRLILPIEGAKTVETRQRRIEKTLSLLREGRIQ